MRTSASTSRAARRSCHRAASKCVLGEESDCLLRTAETGERDRNRSHGLRIMLLHGTLRNAQRAGDLSHLQPFEYAQHEHIPGALRQCTKRVAEAFDRLLTCEDALGS